MPAARTPLRVAAATLVAAVAIQFVPVKRDNPPVTSEVDAPPDVKAILERSCYDCHSNRTRWPWYSRVAPVSWLVAWDVRRGRDELNFTEWPAFDFEEQEDHLDRAAKMVDRQKMPLPIYVLMHGDARLSVEQRRRLVNWARGE